MILSPKDNIKVNESEIQTNRFKKIEHEDPLNNITLDISSEGLEINEKEDDEKSLLKRSNSSLSISSCNIMD